jgi:hypothetical protein
LWPDRPDLDGLIQESIAHAERRGLQRKPLVAAAGFDPVRHVARIGHEYGDAGRSADLPRVALVLGLCR